MEGTDYLGEVMNAEPCVIIIHYLTKLVMIVRSDPVAVHYTAVRVIVI